MAEQIVEKKTFPCIFCMNAATSPNLLTNMTVASYKCDVCGLFAVGEGARLTLESRKLSKLLYVNCIAENIKLNNLRTIPVWLFVDNGNKLPEGYVLRNLNDFEDGYIDHASKPKQILTLAAEKVHPSGPFGEFQFTLKDIYSLKIDGSREMIEWLNVVIRNGYLKSYDFSAHFKSSGRYKMDIPNYKFNFTPSGWREVSEITPEINSKKVFIAMDFKTTQRAEIQNAIEKGCRDAGFDAFTIDKKHFNGQITDEIVAKIKESKFIVADFTDHNNGVYFEAGYALGIGRQVIFTVPENDLKEKKVHFDTSHFNHIGWKDPADLQKKLSNRINAVFNGKDK